MALDISRIGAKGTPGERSWTSDESALYAISVGAGSVDPLEELAFTTENATDQPQLTLPCFVTTLPLLSTLPLRTDTWPSIGDVDRRFVLHGSESFELFKLLPVQGHLRTEACIESIWDKGSGALVTIREDVTDLADDSPLAAVRTGLFVKGEGGFGGDSGPEDTWQRPDQAPDHEVVYQTRPEQALLFRLNGDHNPLHTDPLYAAKAGFDRPILHGMCTYGFTSRALLHTLAEGNPARFISMSGRFARPTWPGDTLSISIWIDGNQARFQTKNQRGEVVIDRGEARVR